jgi:hypothetical protein
MRIPRRPATTLKMALACLLAVGALAQAAEFHGGPAADGPAAASKRPGFKIRGNVTGLYPGLTKPMRLTVTNPNPFSIRLTRVRVRVLSPTVGCTGSAIKVRPYVGHKKIGPHRRARVTTSVRVMPTIADACQGTRFRLQYSGKAGKA